MKKTTWPKNHIKITFNEVCAVAGEYGQMSKARIPCLALDAMDGLGRGPVMSFLRGDRTSITETIYTRILKAGVPSDDIGRLKNFLIFALDGNTAEAWPDWAGDTADFAEQEKAGLNRFLGVAPFTQKGPK